MPWSGGGAGQSLRARGDQLRGTEARAREDGAGPWGGAALGAGEQLRRSFEMQVRTFITHSSGARHTGALVYLAGCPAHPGGLAESRSPGRPG